MLKSLELKRSIAELLIIDIFHRQHSHINLSALYKEEDV